MTHILLVEPDAILRELYRRSLQKADWTVAAVGDGQEAVEACDRLAPDLIILELHLPSHNGIGFLQELRSYREWRYIPVMLYTFAPPSRITAANRKQLGIVSHLYKPKVSIQDFIINVQDTLRMMV